MFVSLPLLAQHKKYGELVLKKSLGQYYLHDAFFCEKIAQQIIEAPCANLLEVGPGAGAISKYLFQATEKNYTGIEIDEEKIAYLRKKFPQTHFIHQDFLEFEIKNEILLCGNYPYNISAPILFKVLENMEHIPIMIGMFQKEVAERVAAKPRTKSYGILSVLIQSYYATELLFDIPPEAFVPPPKVWSSLISLHNRQNPYKILNFDKYKKFVKAAFSQRRKTLYNTLKTISVNIPDSYGKKRAEELSPEEFAELYHYLYS